MGLRSVPPSLRRVGVVVLLAVAVVIVPRVELAAVPPAGVTWSLALTLASQDAATAVWESDEIRADVTLAGLSWTDEQPSAAWIRGSVDGEEWSPWTELVIDADHGPDPGTDEFLRAKQASEPVYLGEVEWVQYRVAGERLPEVSAEFVETAGRTRGVIERFTDLFGRLRFVIDTDSAYAQPSTPTIVGRDTWGGDQCLGPDAEEPRYNDGVEVMFVHHTATTNSYSQAGAADVIYSICNYHVHTNGWRDIGYNFLIDKYGTIYEGRAGGADLAVWGGHTGGFNYYSTGVALLGDHNSAAVSQATLASLQELAAWKLDVHHVDPTSSVVIESLGSTRYDQGVLVDMPRLAGHLDASSTSCPGGLCYPLLDDYRPLVLADGGPKILGGRPNINPPTVDTPLDFDFDITTESDWTFTLSDLDGTVLHTASGSGVAATVAWDGLVGGTPLDAGEYRVSVVATPAEGPAPTPIDRIYEFYVAPFRDDDTSVHESAIIAIAEADITQGCSDFFVWWFCPDHEVTRDQMASFIARAMDLPDSTVDHFTDDDGNTHEAAINAIADAGITLGCGPEAFCPRLAITRAEMAAFLARALDLPTGDEAFFIDVAGHRHEDAINAIAVADITLGCRETLFCPDDVVVRAQMASFLTRAFLTPQAPAGP